MPFAILLGFIFPCFLVAVCIYGARARSRTRTEIVFRYLGLIVRQNMPLPLALQFAGRGETGATRRALVRIGRLVQMGLSLSEALRRAYPQCPGLLLSNVQMGERTGTTPAVLQDINEDIARSFAANRVGTAGRWGYVVMTALAVACVSYWVQYFVTPRLTVIAEDFEVVIPSSTMNILTANPFSVVSPTSGIGWTLRLFLVGASSLPAILVIGGLARLRPRRAERLGWTYIIEDAARWHLWPLNRISRAVARASTARTIRLATAAGWPLHDAVLQAADTDLNYVWRKRLGGWSQSMCGGGEPVASGRMCNVPEIFLRAVAIGIRDGDLDAPLNHTEEYYSVLARRWSDALVQITWPLVTLAVAAIVGMYCYGLIAVMRAVVDHCCAIIG